MIRLFMLKLSCLMHAFSSSWHFIRLPKNVFYSRAWNILHACAFIFLVQRMPCTANEDLPRLILIGDSTVKCGHANGIDQLWGWGQVLAEKFDTTRIKIENHARGGRSSRTFLTEGPLGKNLRARTSRRLRPDAVWPQRWW